MDTCYVSAIITPKPGMEDTVKAAILDNIPTVRQENGCIRYDLHEKKSAPGTVFMFYEIWADRAALDAHAKAPHMLAYRTKVKDLLAAPTAVDIWTAVDVRS